MKKGEVTAFLSLIFLLVLSFIGVMIESASIQVLKNNKRVDADFAIENVFAEYQKELLAEYDIFALDATYDTEEYQDKKVMQRMEFYGADMNGSEIQTSEFLTDAQGMPFYKEAIRYIENKIGIDGMHESDKIDEVNGTKQEDILAWEKQEESGKQSEEEEDIVQNELDTMLQETEEGLPKDNNPIETISNIKKSNLLQLVFPKAEQLSNKQLEKEKLVSKRELNHGKGSFTEQSKHNEVTEKLFFHEYLIEHFSDITQSDVMQTEQEKEKELQGNMIGQVEKELQGNAKKQVEGKLQGNVTGQVEEALQGNVKRQVEEKLQGNVTGQVEEALQDNMKTEVKVDREVRVREREKKQEQALDYELEYLIGNSENDRKNLETVLKKIITIRLALNYAYLVTDEEKNAEAEVMALGLCTLLTVPGITEVVKHAILLAWAYGESIVDIRELVAGKKIAAVKNAENWNLQLSKLPELANSKQEESTEKDEAETGMTYRDYIRGLLLLEKKEKLCMRALDLMESNLGIRADACIVRLQLKNNSYLRRGIRYQFPTYFGYQ